MTIAGQTYTLTQSAPPGCTYAISPLSKSAVAAGETTTVTVTAAAGCTWTAATAAEWIAITGGATGDGNGTVTMAIAPNPETTQRSAVVTIAGRTFTVTQVGTSACAFTIDPSATSSPAAGETTSVTVSTGDACVWTAASGAPWIIVNSGLSGTGSGTVTMTIGANTAGAPQRTGTVTIAGQTFSVTQAPGTCTYTVTPASLSVPAAGLASSISIVTSAGCSWSAAGMPAWFAASAATQTGSGLLSYTIAANAGTARTAILTIGGQTVNVSQAGVVPSAPANLRVVRDGQ